MKIYNFSATNCAPCRLMKPVWQQVKNNYNDNNLEFIDIIVNKTKNISELLSSFNICQVPSIVITDTDNKILALHKGFIAKEHLIKLIDEQTLE